MTIHLFAIARDIARNSVYHITDEQSAQCRTVGDVRHLLCQALPALTELRSFAIAVNRRIADDAMLIHPDDELAVIPPVSGG